MKTPFLRSAAGTDFYSVPVGNLNATAPFTALAVLQPTGDPGGIFGGLDSGDGFELTVTTASLITGTSGSVTSAQTAVTNLSQQAKIVFAALAVPAAGNQTLFTNGSLTTDAIGLSAGGVAPRLLTSAATNSVNTGVAMLGYTNTAFTAALLEGFYQDLQKNLNSGMLALASLMQHAWLAFDNPTGRASSWVSRGTTGGLAATPTFADSNNPLITGDSITDASWF